MGKFSTFSNKCNILQVFNNINDLCSPFSPCLSYKNNSKEQSTEHDSDDPSNATRDSVEETGKTNVQLHIPRRVI